jgi:hypothetical protein
MRKLVALLLVFLVLSSPAFAQFKGPDQRALNGNIHTRGLNITTFLRNGINVSQPPFNAVADGVTDNTAAFNAALATGFPVYVPESTKCFAVSNLSLLSTSVIFGDTGPLYSVVGVARSCITGTLLATNIINPNTFNSQIIQNVDIIGDVTRGFSKAVSCIAGGSTNMSIINASVRFCGNGGIGDTTNQTATAALVNVYTYGNGQANGSSNIENLVDSHVTGGFAAAGNSCVDFPSGSNDNDVDGLKCEFSITYGYVLQDNTSRNVIHGGVCDNNAFGCGKSGNVSATTIGPMVWKRNGRGTNGSTFNYGQNNHWFVNGNTQSIVFTGINTITGINDGGGGTLGPPICMTFNAGTDNQVTIGDSDMTGCTAGPVLFNSTAPVNLAVSNVQGWYPQPMQGRIDLTGEFTISQVATPAAPTIGNSGATGAATWSYKAVPCSAPNYCAAATAAGSTTTGNATLTTSNFNTITIVPVKGVMFTDIYRTAVGTSPTTLGKIGTIYAGNTVLNDTGQAGNSVTAPSTNTTGAFLMNGQNALYQDNTNNNTALGWTSFISTISQAGGGTNGTNNVALGNGALNANTTGYENTAVGFQAMNGNTTGITNTAVGWQAMNGNTTGSANTAVGEQALFTNTTGSNNVAVGTALFTLNGGVDNTGVGFQALNNATTGGNNVAIGYQSGKTVTGGGNNTIIGNQVASTTLTTGTNNILIGVSTAVDTAATGTSNTIQIGGTGASGGAGSITITGTNTLSTEATTLRGTLTMTDIASDATHTDATVCEDTTTHTFFRGSGTASICLGSSSKRYKHDIHPLTDGIAEIEGLKPVNFFYKKGFGDDGEREQYGLIAEDVVNVIPKLVTLDKDGRPNSVDYMGLVPILINAMQEQQLEIAHLKAVNDPCGSFGGFGKWVMGCK